ncbi:recombinase family protein [Halobacteriovorax marinus]|uniref:recombinase family protein n=1 Tax=Halobacteriovorax marinus TaxID=97084 RepID=UPI003A8C97BB
MKYLKLHGIQIREVGFNIRRKRGLAYGEKMVLRQKEEHKREQQYLTKMKSLREKGFSYWKIADILNTMKVPTKRRKGKWHSKTVYSILVRNEPYLHKAKSQNII